MDYVATRPGAALFLVVLWGCACHHPADPGAPADPGHPVDSADTAVPRSGAVAIPAGSFTMGSPRSESGRMSDEGPQIELKIAAFELDVVPVTVARFEAQAGVAGTWGEAVGACNLGTDRAGHPANCVSWRTARSFCELQGGRLPTEAEWEYAARAGTETAWWWGPAFEEARAVSSVGCGEWGCAGGTGEVAEVGDRCNAWGVCDVTGNVLQWTSTAYQEELGEYVHEPLEPGAGDPVLRGGAWSFDDTDFLRIATRFIEHAPLGDEEFGFRCAY